MDRLVEALYRKKLIEQDDRDLSVLCSLGNLSLVSVWGCVYIIELERYFDELGHHNFLGLTMR